MAPGIADGSPHAAGMWFSVPLSALAAGLLALLPAAPVAAQAVLLPPNVHGSFSDAEVEALVTGFVERVEALSQAPLDRLDGDPCPLPEACVADLPPEPEAIYWLQLSGSPGAALAVAARLAPGAEVRARAAEEGDDLALLGAALADAVSAGPCPGLDVLTDRRGAGVYLDGEWLGRTPLHTDRILDSGRYRVTVVTRGGARAMALLQARVGERAVLELDFDAVPPGPATLKKRRAWPLIPMIAGGLVAGILVATDPAGIVGPDHRITIVTGP